MTNPNGPLRQKERNGIVSDGSEREDCLEASPTRGSARKESTMEAGQQDEAQEIHAAWERYERAALDQNLAYARAIVNRRGEGSDEIVRALAAIDTEDETHAALEAAIAWQRVSARFSVDVSAAVRDGHRAATSWRREITS